MPEAACYAAAPGLPAVDAAERRLLAALGSPEPVRPAALLGDAESVLPLYALAAGLVRGEATCAVQADVEGGAVAWCTPAAGEGSS
jgi:hypothetical protein